MEKHWYLSRNGHIFGPVTDAQLFQSVAAGRVLPADLLNVAGEPEWVTANTVPGLFLVLPNEPVLAELEDDGPVVADVIEEPRIARVTCLACFREVSISITPGVATAHCPRCRAAIDTGETAAPQPAHQAAFGKLESPAAFKERMQQKVAAAEAASARDGAILGGILGSIIPQ